MKFDGKCPECGGNMSHVCTGDAFIPRKDGGIDAVAIEHWSCKNCGHKETWSSDPISERAGAEGGWLKKKLDAWRRSAAGRKEKKEQAERLREKETQRKDDPWN